MQAIRIHYDEGSSVLKMDEVPKPDLVEEQILIKTAAIGLNGADWIRGRAQPAEGQADPVIVGYDVAGTVEAVGPQVMGWTPGDRVMALARNTYAEYVIASPVLACPPPVDMSFSDAASIPCATLTAWYGLSPLAQMRPGETVVIHAAGSGVGVAGTQIAKALGGRVIATAGSDVKLEKARGLGADAGINYSTQDVAAELLRLTGGQGVDVVLDSVGGAVFDATLGALARGGRIIVVGSPAGPKSTPDPKALESKGQQVLNASVFAQTANDVEGEGWAQLVSWLNDGTLRTVVDRVFPWTEAESAQRALMDRAVFGKVVMTVT